MIEKQVQKLEGALALPLNQYSDLTHKFAFDHLCYRSFLL